MLRSRSSCYYQVNQFNSVSKHGKLKAKIDLDNISAFTFVGVNWLVLLELLKNPV